MVFTWCTLDRLWDMSIPWSKPTTKVVSNDSSHTWLVNESCQHTFNESSQPEELFHFLISKISPFLESKPYHTVDGSEILHQLMGSLSIYLPGFKHPMWCRISSINSMFRLELMLFELCKRGFWKGLLRIHQVNPLEGPCMYFQNRLNRVYK